MSDARLAYISNHVMPSLKKNQKGIKTIKFEPTEDRTAGEHYQSVAIFGDILIEYDEGEVDDHTQTKNEDVIHPQNRNEQSPRENETGSKCHEVKENRLGVVMKMQICDKIAMSWTNGGLNFFNEIFFYTDILPYFKTKIDDINELFPEIVHGHFSNDNKREEDVIILKDLRRCNYRMATERVFLSLEHVLLALKRLGKFHACSYIMKSLDYEHFMNKMNTLKLTKPWTKNSNSSVYGHFAKCTERYVTYLETLPEYQNKMANLKQYLDNLSENLPKIFETNRKMSVLCHGDFNRNNMFFKYATKNIKTDDIRQLETENGRVHQDKIDGDDPTKTYIANPIIDVKFFDLADVMYGSPVFDLAFFIFMNTTQHLRTNHWDMMIRTYHDSVQAEADRFDNVTIPSYADICEEFKTNSIMAFLICSFFLPMMMEEHRSERSEWSEKTDKENMDAILNVGGQKATIAVAEILMHMLDRGFM